MARFLLWWSPVGHRYGEDFGEFPAAGPAIGEAKKRMQEFSTHGAYGALDADVAEEDRLAFVTRVLDYFDAKPPAEKPQGIYDPNARFTIVTTIS